ncbi:MAG: leucine-rich repeat protein, partial [Bacteroidales bacterium]|nr:leucine-rich repeat protein [Bacteroidales bacterium]
MVTRIGYDAFNGCSYITGIYIGVNITAIENHAFSRCTGITSIEYNARECYSNMFEISNHGGAFSPATPDVNNGYSYNIQSVIIGDSVRVIPPNFMYQRTSLQTLTMGNNVEVIGDYAFCNCVNITSNVVFPNTVRVIGSSAFYNCDWLSNFPFENLTAIGDRAFQSCHGVTSVNANQAISIGSFAFTYCENLISCVTNANNIGGCAFSSCSRLVTVALGNSVLTIGNEAFRDCYRLQSVSMGDNITSLGNSVFFGCVRLEQINLSTSLTTIGTHAFDGCSLLSGKLTFPATITNIGDYAFTGTGTITGINMLGTTPPTIYAHTFASVSNSTPVSVPCGAVISYYTTNYWENFSNFVEAPPYELTVESNNGAMGSATISQQPTCNNHSAIIQATAETGFHFLQWNDGNGTNPRTIQMTQDSTFTAIFVPNNSYIVIEPNDPTMGTTSGTGTYGYNAPVTMTATAYSGYHFLKWNDGNTQNPRYMAATRDTTFTAIFVSNVSTITVLNANPEWGNVGGSGVYYYQNLVSLTATPIYGYHFSQWNDGNTQNPRTIVINQDSTFTAYFAVNTYSIVATSNSTTMGSVSGGGTYTYLHEMSLTATPAYGYHFVQWNDQNTDNPRTITVTRDSSFTAQFAANSYTITAEPNDPTMGSAYGSGTYNYNTTATLTAVAEYGYHFTQWSDGVTDNPRTVTVQNSATYTAQFEINSYILTVQSSNPAIGTTSGGGSYNYLTPVNITAIPNAGYHFTQWSDGNTDNPRLVSVTANATYTAQFAINSYAVSVTCNNTSMGAVSGSGTYNHNSTATLTATAYYGYHFVQWQDGNTENPRSVVVTDSTQYTAQFDFNSYLITTNSSNVTLGSAIGGGSYNYLSQVALTAVPVPHYHFTMWNDSIEDNSRTIIVTRDSVFTAHFAIDRHTIGVHTADATQGTVSGNDTVDYNTAV